MHSGTRLICEFRLCASRPRRCNSSDESWCHMGLMHMQSTRDLQAELGGAGDKEILAAVAVPDFYYSILRQQLDGHDSTVSP